jgi:Transglutaminase-like enzymes, putative cysteine proteases
MKKILFIIPCLCLFTLNIAKAQDTSSFSLTQESAMAFLKQYMPLSDRADYDNSFFAKQVKTAFEARNYFSWGKKVPEDIFKHFVLVYRVNNEDLDTSRVLFFQLLKDRVKGLSMHDAALEVNHFCHQYVNYKASDSRTSSPLASMRTGNGRCGEESTFTVTALRSVCIPARQCYTPRWAHTDDNHAWVEVWVDGKWYFLGACEPEAELNVAWFTAPAKRAMMVHTNVFGSDYSGEEEINYKGKLYSVINLLQNYAPTKKVFVNVKDAKGNNVKDATVAFGLYNYAEYYPLAKVSTDANGLASLTTGLGDLMIWANKDSAYAYKKMTVKETDTLYLSLKPNRNREYEDLVELVPPVPRAIPVISSDKEAINKHRLLQEDSIRNSYLATFPTESQIEEFAQKVPSFSKDDVKNIIKESCGNYKDIEDFLLENKTNSNAIAMLKVVAEKDLRDTPKSILQSHLDYFAKTQIKVSYSQDIIEKYILCPRIQLERISTWREYIQNNINSLFGSMQINAPNQLAVWINDSIQINTTDNYYGCIISPAGVLKTKIGDRYSKDILFVALCRSLGFAAKYDFPTGCAQYYSNGEWLKAFPEKQTRVQTNNDKCILNVHNQTATNKIKPEYYSHFTLAKFTNGTFVTLDYENEGAFDSFPARLELEPGYYRLLTGNRANDGTVYVKTDYFYLNPNTTSDIFVELRQIPNALEVQGTIKMKEKVSLIGSKEKSSLAELAGDKGLVIAFLDPNREPSRHIMVDIPLFKAEFEQWKGGMLFVVPDDKLTSSFSVSNYTNLPKQSLFAIDKDRKLLKSALKAMNKDIKDNFPCLLLVKPNGEVIFYSEGYRIGVGENLIKTIYQLDNAK